MSIIAVVEDGAIKLPREATWKSGTLVRVETIDTESPALLDTLEEFDGVAGDLPPDMAANLDHYIHGHPRQ